MKDYGDTRHQTIEERRIVPFEDPIGMADAQKNFAFSIKKILPNRDRIHIDLEGYLELNVLMETWQSTGAGFKAERNI